MSDDEAQGDAKKLEEQYAAEVNELDDEDIEALAKKRKLAKPPWALVVKLTFGSAEKVEQAKKLVSSYADWVRENEPKTLSYSMLCSENEPLQVCILERYEDKSYAYNVAHKTSPEFFKFKPALAALEPQTEEHSYYESGGGFLSR